jgi:cell division protein ZapB
MSDAVPETQNAADESLLAEVMERVERLLVRYEELQRTNALLRQELDGANAERESLRSRLSAARARVDALIERLPSPEPASTH